jgi:hypothetical protein
MSLGVEWEKEEKIYSREVLVSHVGFDGFTGVRYF